MPPASGRMSPLSIAQGGGFLARDWGSGPTVALHKVSFALHEELAKELDIQSYRKIPVLSVAPGKRTKRTTDLCPWLDGEIRDSSMMDDEGGAQVAPLELCTKLVEAAVANGAELRIGEVQGVGVEEGARGRQLCSVTIDGEDVEASKLCVCMGPWSTLAQEWFDIPVQTRLIHTIPRVPCLYGVRHVPHAYTVCTPFHIPHAYTVCTPCHVPHAVHQIPMTGIKSTSVVFKDESAVEPFALFCGEDDRHGTHLEVYPRNSGEIYLCGIGGSECAPHQAALPQAAPPQAAPHRPSAATPH